MDSFLFFIGYFGACFIFADAITEIGVTSNDVVENVNLFFSTR